LISLINPGRGFFRRRSEAVPMQRVAPTQVANASRLDILSHPERRMRLE
jgi:hypothetical protein